MHTQTHHAVPAALEPFPPPHSVPSLAQAPLLPGLESVAPLDPDDGWLHTALLGPFSADITDYLRLARTVPGPVLDLGSGAGRLAVPFARHGFRVEAVDHDAPSLARLMEWAGRFGPRTRRLITTTQTDLIRLRPQGEYQLALLAGSMVAAIPPRARPGVLREVANRLGTGGALALDYTAHRLSGLVEQPDRTQAFQVPRFDEVTEWVVARQSFDIEAMREHITYYCERSEKSRIRRSVLTTDKWVIDGQRLSDDLVDAGLRICHQRERHLDERTRSVLLVCHTAT